MIEKITMYDKKIEKTGFTGRTLDLSGGKRKRSYNMRRSMDNAGKSSPSGGMSRHHIEYA